MDVEPVDAPEPYTAAERRHMRLWGAVAVVVLTVGVAITVVSVTAGSGPTLAGTLLMGLAAGLANLASQPRRVRWQERMRERRQRQSEALG